VRDFCFLHPDLVALRALPLALFVKDVPLQLFHLNLATLTGHDLNPRVEDSSHPLSLGVL
jgi:hypothetical protein